LLLLRLLLLCRRLPELASHLCLLPLEMPTKGVIWRRSGERRDRSRSGR